jgi:hypothetical protein
VAGPETNAEGNIVTHRTPLKAPVPGLLIHQTLDRDGRRCLLAVATGLVPMSLAGRTHSVNHNVDIDIELPFAPAGHVLSVALRGMELRGLARFGFRRVGWSVVDYASRPDGDGVRVNVTLWVNNAAAVSLGIIYNCTALSAPLAGADGGGGQ